MPLDDTLLHIEWSTIKIEGIDAKKFLQGQLTCDVEAILPNQFQLAAHCNPQGRIISFFRLFYVDNHYYLLMPESMTSIALASLKKYALFYKTTLKIDNDSAMINTLTALADLNTVDHDFIPVIYPETSSLFLPHDLNLANLNAISFNKGCFTGQEIIARMHYRGKLKNHLYLATIMNEQKPTPGQLIYSQDNGKQKASGTLVNVFARTDQGYDAFVVLDEQHAKNNHLFLENNNQQFFIIKRKC